MQTAAISSESAYPSAYPLADRYRSASVVLALLAFLLSGIPKLHLSIVAPLYAVDLIVLYLLIKSRRKPRHSFAGYPRIMIQIVACYLCFVVLGELRGGLIYARPFESFYLLIRSCLAVSLIYIIPQQIQTLLELKLVLKGLCLGLLLSASIAILYSVPVTRGLTDAVFSIKMIAPNSDKIVGSVNAVYDKNFDGSYRGLTLLGASTFSSGVMATLWPMLLIPSAAFKFEGAWKQIHRLAIVLVPLGILATYGRSAWLSVLLVMLSVLLWGSQKGRLRFVFFAVLAGLLIGQVGVDAIAAKLPLVDRVINKTQVTLTSGVAKESEAERFLAYVEPFEHVTRYPSFLVAGSGAAQRRWQGNAYEEADTASHAIPGMAYYAYGVGGSLCQIALMGTAFLTIYRRLNTAQRYLPSTVGIWRSLLACWCGLLPWWCFGHGIVTAPRGAMIFFFFMGMVLACDRISTHLVSQQSSASITQY